MWITERVDFPAATGEDADELGRLLRLAVPGNYGHKWANADRPQPL